MALKYRLCNWCKSLATYLTPISLYAIARFPEKFDPLLLTIRTHLWNIRIDPFCLSGFCQVWMVFFVPFLILPADKFLHCCPFFLHVPRRSPPRFLPSFFAHPITLLFSFMMVIISFPATLCKYGFFLKKGVDKTDGLCYNKCRT